jgi:hypothetical protein
MSELPSFVEFEAQVSAAMLKHFGITWNDASGEVQLLEKARAEGRSPDEFVTWFGERYDLNPVQSNW